MALPCSPASSASRPGFPTPSIPALGSPVQQDGGGMVRKRRGTRHLPGAVG